MLADLGAEPLGRQHLLLRHHLGLHRRGLSPRQLLRLSLALILCSLASPGKESTCEPRKFTHLEDLASLCCSAMDTLKVMSHLLSPVVNRKPVSQWDSPGSGFSLRTVNEMMATSLTISFAPPLSLLQAIDMQNCDVYSYKGDGEMDPLSTFPSSQFPPC